MMLGKRFLKKCILAAALAAMILPNGQTAEARRISIMIGHTTYSDANLIAIQPNGQVWFNVPLNQLADLPGAVTFSNSTLLSLNGTANQQLCKNNGFSFGIGADGRESRYGDSIFQGASSIQEQYPNRITPMTTPACHYVAPCLSVSVALPASSGGANLQQTGTGPGGTLQPAGSLQQVESHK